MKTYRIAIIMVLCLVGMSVIPSEATTTFVGSTIIGIDQGQRTLTFRTVEGQSWTLPVADPNILKEKQLSKGDQVTIELDMSDRISKVIKLAERPRSESNQSS